MVDHLTVLDLSDVIGLRFDCRGCQGCHTSVSFRLRSENKVHFPPACSACGADWERFNPHQVAAS